MSLVSRVPKRAVPTRKFDGVTYRLWAAYDTHQTAYRKAKLARMGGKTVARVIKMPALSVPGPLLIVSGSVPKSVWAVFTHPCPPV